MRIAIIAILSAATVSFAYAASAAPASVEVKIGPELQTKAAKTYGVHEINELAGELRKSVENTLAKTHAYDDSRIQLTLVDAVPNRPTIKQMGDRPGLSSRSFGIGGAKIAGEIVAADGKVTPVGFKWYETDIRWEHTSATWSDAQRTFDQFARKLSRGEAIAAR